MKVRLGSGRNTFGDLVVVLDIPPFLTGPDVIVWEGRFFQHMGEFRDGMVSFAEVFGYVYPSVGQAAGGSVPK